MSEGRQRCWRSMLVAQANLVWATATAAEIESFIESGHFGELGDVLPYDPNVMASIARINGGEK